MKFLAHRGWWFSAEEKNTELAFRRAFSEGFGVETDLRDYCGEIVISHDVPREKTMTFREFMQLTNDYDSGLVLALNIKSDGLQSLVKDIIGDSLSYFCFDMSVPDSLGYFKHKLKFFSRKSDIEDPSLYEQSQGVWLDCFYENKLDLVSLEKYLFEGKFVALVSPELHGFEYKLYWDLLLNFLSQHPNFSDNIYLCTDFPGKAKEYFDALQ